MGNAEKLANCTKVDGAKFMFRKVESDRMQQLYEHLFDRIQAVTGLSTVELKGQVKFRALRHEQTTHGSLYSIQLFGDAASHIHYLPWSFAAVLTEYHVKCYLIEGAEGDLQMFQKAAWEGPTVVNLSQVKSKPRKGRAKDSGDAGLRIGSRKSDKHAIVYRRRGEYPGFEGRIKDAELKSCVAKVEMMREVVNTEDDKMKDLACWEALRAVAARLAFAYALKMLRQMGVNIVMFFPFVAARGQNKNSASVEALDYDEELSMVMATMKL